MEKSLLYMTLALVCVYLIIDAAIGKDRIGAFLATLFPSIFN